MNSAANTDWWMFTATILSGILTAVASIIAVILSNKETRKQITHEKVMTDKQSKYVVLIPSLLTTTFAQILDKLIINNDYNRVLLFSGDDGFEFFDNTDKNMNYRQRILMVQNQSLNDIKNIIFETYTELLDTDTNQRSKYSTKNQIKLLRSHESFLVRLENDEQFIRICEMNKSKIGSKLEFKCEIIYETLASQRIKYVYHINMHNDKTIEVIKDGVESVKDIEGEDESKIEQTVFRNLQDTISSVDRSKYAWDKMATSQAAAAVLALSHARGSNPQSDINDNKTEGQ